MKSILKACFLFFLFVVCFSCKLSTKEKIVAKSLQIQSKTQDKEALSKSNTEVKQGLPKSQIENSDQKPQTDDRVESKIIQDVQIETQPEGQVGLNEASSGEDHLRSIGIGIGVLIGGFAGAAAGVGASYAVGKSLGSGLSQSHFIEGDREIKGMERQQINPKQTSEGVVYRPASGTFERMIVFLPGNQQYQSFEYDKIFAGLGETQAAIYTLNYQGLSSGETAPSNAGKWIEQSKNLIKRAVQDAGGNPAKVTVVGHSMGGALGAYAVSDLHQQGLPVKFVAHNTFSSFGDAAAAKKASPFSAAWSNRIAALGGWRLDVAKRFQSIPKDYRIHFDAEFDSHIGEARLGDKLPEGSSIKGRGHYTNIFSDRNFRAFHQKSLEPPPQSKLRGNLPAKIKAGAVGGAIGAAAGVAAGVIHSTSKQSNSD